MKDQGSFLGTLIIIWVVVAMVASYSYSCGGRRRGFLALLLGVIATVVLIGWGVQMSMIMGQPPVSGYVDIGIGVLFCLMMFDGIRGIVRNGVKPLALAVFIAVLVVLAISFTT